MALPLVAIVGVPNVGKSTLFNRLVRRRRAIVTDEPGVTRDRLYGEVRDAATPFRLVDTGGLTPGVDAPFAQEIERQAGRALDEAALILFVVDARSELSGLEMELAGQMRRHPTPLLLVANKVDGEAVEATIHDLHRVGLGEPIPISAEHGRGVDQLLEAIEAHLGAVEPTEESEPDDSIRVALVGRPNVGKSSLLNRLVGEERTVVSEIPGTTRDAIDTLLTFDDRRYRLIDTAGIRRRGRVQRGVERFSVASAKRSIERCDVAVLVLDGTEELAAQDAHIAGFILDAFKPMLVVVNKWDIVPERQQATKDWEERVRHRLRFAKQVPLLSVSAKSGQRVAMILQHIDRLYESAGRWIPTAELNRWMNTVRGLDGETPASRHGLRLLYATQTGVYPPTILMFCNDPKAVHFSTRRFLENGLRQSFEFGPSPIRLQFRSRREARRP